MNVLKCIIFVNFVFGLILNCCSQNLKLYDKKELKKLKSNYSFIVDTIWLDDMEWNEFEINKNKTDSIPKTYRQAKKCKYIFIPGYQINKKGMKYTLNSDFLNCIEADSSYFAVYIIYKAKAIGYYTFFKRNDRWGNEHSILLCTSDEQGNFQRERLSIAYDEMNKDNSYGFVVKCLDGIWRINKNKDCEVFYTINFQPVNDYIRRVPKEQGIRNCAKMNFGLYTPPK